MREKINLRFLLGVYIVLLGFIVIITAVVFAMYGNIATTTKEVINVDAHKSAVENLGTLAQSFADLIKVTVGAVIGALSAALQSIMSKKTDDNDGQSTTASDETPT